MKDRPELIAAICRPHCRFFKPGVKEDMTCGGYEEIARRAAADMIARWASMFSKEAPPKECAHDPRIERLICDQCDFRVDGCDFMAAEPPAGAVPCGGYVLIKRLAEAGEPEVERWLK